MYNIWKGDRALIFSITGIVLISVSTPQLWNSIRIVDNPNIIASYDVYAQFPPGLRPPPGQQFPPVPPGLNEVQARVVAGAFGQVAGGSTSSRSAICSSDEVVTGGGSEVTGGGNLINPTHRDYAQPTNNPDRWTVTVTNPGPNPIEIRAFAVCAKLAFAP